MSEYEVIEMQTEARSMLDRAGEIVVQSDEQYAAAGEFIQGCKALAKKIEDAHRPNIERWHQGHKAAIADRDADLKPVTAAIAMASRPALDYKREQDRLAREEAQRIEDERRKKIEEDRLAEAERLDAEGRPEEAEAVIAAPIQTPRPYRQESAVPKVAGLSTRARWKVRVTNPRLVAREFCMPDPQALQLHVDRLWPKGTPSEQKVLSDERRREIEAEMGGGVEIYLEDGFSVRTK